MEFHKHFEYYCDQYYQYTLHHLTEFIHLKGIETLRFFADQNLQILKSLLFRVSRRGKIPR